MRKHSFPIIPMTIGYNTGLHTNAFITFDNNVYNARTDRGVLMYSPFESKFKMRKVNADPYLEPCFFGVKPGDYLEVEFEAIGNDAFLDFQIGEISNAYVNTAKVFVTNGVNVKSSFYKKYRTTVPVTSAIANNALGIYLNIKMTTANKEVLFRNMTIQVNTNNPMFSLKNNYVMFNSKRDFVKSIKYYSKMDFAHASGLEQLLTNGEITFPTNDVMKVQVASANFGGIVSHLPTTKYRSPVAIYFEYKCAQAVKGSLYGFKDGTKTELALNYFVAATDWTKAFMIGNNMTTSLIEDLWVEVGRSGAVDLEIRNVVIGSIDNSDGVPNSLDTFHSTGEMKRY